MRIVPINITAQNEAERLMKEYGVTEQGVKILSPKTVFYSFILEGISSWEANIIKQHLLSLGSDSAISRDALVKDIKTSTLVFGTKSQLQKLCQKLSVQPFNLRNIAETLSVYLDNVSRENHVFEARGKLIRLKKPIVCGIINVTPDSFSGDGLLAGRSNSNSLEKDVLNKVSGMIRDGAKMIDIGGESTRPFSEPIKESEEIKRIIPVLKLIRCKFKKLPISCDTYKYKVAQAAVDYGADIINDITALRKSPKISCLIKKYKLGCILMHMQANPLTMQNNPVYRDVVCDLMDFFSERLNYCRKQGISSNQIAIDPGIGFGKKLNDNLQLLKRMKAFKSFGVPVFLGVSRKSFIADTLNRSIGERLSGTIASSVVSILNGVSMLRVHDVRAAADMVDMVWAIKNS